MHAPEEAAEQHAALTAAARPPVPVRHRRQPPPVIDHVNEPGTYQKPVEKVAEFLDGLDAAQPPLARRRCIAALGPKMLELAATRTSAPTPTS